MTTENLKFHQKQRDCYCGEHALNNLFQENKFISDTNNLDTLININGQFNLKSFCKYLTDNDLLGGEECSNSSGNYIFEVIYSSIEWFGFDTKIISLQHELEDYPNKDEISYREYCFDQLSRNMDNINLLGCIFQHKMPDHYTCMLKNSENSFSMIESRKIGDAPYNVDLNKDQSLDFLKNNKSWPKGFNYIQQIICVFITESSYKSVSSLNRGNQIAYGMFYKDKLKIYREELDRNKNSFIKCSIENCDFNAISELIHPDGKKEIIKDRIFCSYHYREYSNILNKVKDSKKAIQKILNKYNKSKKTTKIKIKKKSTKNKVTSSSQSNNKCKVLTKKRYTQRTEIIKNGNKVCKARVNIDNCGLPCNNKAKSDELFCGIHLKNQKWGRIDRPQSKDGKWVKNSINYEKENSLGLPIPYNQQDKQININSNSTSLSSDISSSNKSSSSNNTTQSDKKSSDNRTSSSNNTTQSDKKSSHNRKSSSNNTTQSNKKSSHNRTSSSNNTTQTNKSSSRINKSKSNESSSQSNVSLTELPYGEKIYFVDNTFKVYESVNENNLDSDIIFSGKYNPSTGIIDFNAKYD